MTIVPWDYSKAPAPGEGVPQVPTAEGAALGEQVARLCDLEETKQRAQFPNMMPRCNDCAARLGTLPNQVVETQLDLVKCAVEGVPFYCHKGLKEGDDPKRLCTGWVLLASPSADFSAALSAHLAADRSAAGEEKS